MNSSVFIQKLANLNNLQNSFYCNYFLLKIFLKKTVDGVFISSL